MAARYAAIGPVALHFPERVETNDDLAAEFPRWDLDLIAAKTGVYARHIAAPDQTSSTLATNAARMALERAHLNGEDIDLVIAATTTPDARVVNFPMPGGAIGPNVQMMKEAGILHKYSEVLAEFPVVVKAGAHGCRRDP